MIIIIVLLVLGVLLLAMLAIARMVHHHELSLGIQQTAQYLLPMIIVLLNTKFKVKK